MIMKANDDVGEQQKRQRMPASNAASSGNARFAYRYKAVKNFKCNLFGHQDL